MKVHTNPEADENRGLVFEFESAAGDDAEANSRRWEQIDSWLEANLPDNRSSGGMLNGKRAFVSLRFAEDRIF